MLSANQLEAAKLHAALQTALVGASATAIGASVVVFGIAAAGWELEVGTASGFGAGLLLFGLSAYKGGSAVSALANGVASDDVRAINRTRSAVAIQVVAFIAAACAVAVSAAIVFSEERRPGADAKTAQAIERLAERRDRNAAEALLSLRRRQDAQVARAINRLTRELR